MNIFNILNKGKSSLPETSMSAVIGYLLNPSNEHGISDEFLKMFFYAVSQENTLFNPIYEKINSGLYNIQVDLEVRYKHNRKDNDIDIEIKVFDRNWDEEFKVIIENKIKDGAANDMQLFNYYEAVVNGKNLESEENTLDKDKIFAVFLTHDTDSTKIKSEYDTLEISNKCWLNWNSIDNQKLTISKMIKNILQKEHEASISPINEYRRHTFKAFAYYIDRMLSKQERSKLRKGDIGDVKKEALIMIVNEEYKIILRDSGQIQLENEQGEKVEARQLLIKYLEQEKQDFRENGSTRQFGNAIFNYLDLINHENVVIYK